MIGISIGRDHSREYSGDRCIEFCRVTIGKHPSRTPLDSENLVLILNSDAQILVPHLELQIWSQRLFEIEASLL